MEEESKVSSKGHTTKFEKFIFPFILILVSGFFGVMLHKYILSEKPDLRYFINESSPIEIGNKAYYSTTFDIVNSGDTPLEDVIFSASFCGKIVSLRLEPEFTKNGMLLPRCKTDTLSTAYLMTFDLAVGERHTLTFVSECPYLKSRSFLKSKYVIGEIVGIDKKDSGLGFALAIIGMTIAAGTLGALLIYAFSSFGRRSKNN
jgi:hypothetical protein